MLTDIVTYLKTDFSLFFQVKTWFQNRRAKWRRCNVSGSDKTHENNEESEPETDICDDDTPRHEKSNTIIK